MASTSMLAATAARPSDHWVWRPEWTPDRTCLYWYLTFRRDDLAAAVDESARRLVRATDWLDAVPLDWCHVTVADVGFTDELEQSDADDVAAAVSRALEGEDRLRLSFGPALTLRSAVALPAGPLDRLRALQARVRRTTSAQLGARHADVHRHLYWPHLSLGYVNRVVDADTASRFIRALPPLGMRVDVDALTLAAVTRRDHGYQWQVQGRLALRDDRPR
jgi:2'-5' RNA ligase